MFIFSNFGKHYVSNHVFAKDVEADCVRRSPTRRTKAEREGLEPPSPCERRLSRSLPYQFGASLPIQI